MSARRAAVTERVRDERNGVDAELSAQLPQRHAERRRREGEQQRIARTGAEVTIAIAHENRSDVLTGDGDPLILSGLRLRQSYRHPGVSRAESTVERLNQIGVAETSQLTHTQEAVEREETRDGMRDAAPASESQ